MLKEKIYLEENKYVKINAIIGSVSFWVLMFIVFWSYKQPKNEKNQIIISIVVVITLTILLILFSFIKIKFHRWVFVFLIFAGILSLFIQPVLNIPDEAAHFARAEMISEGHIIVGQKDKEFPSIQSVNDLQHFGKTAFTKTDLKNKKINYTPTTVKHVAATNLSFLYLPQTMGILLAKVLHMDAIWLLWFGRIMNLLCYGIIVASAVKIAPKWKFVLFFMASLPMSIQQAASFSPDAIINGLSILTIGYFIYLYDKKTITIKEYCIFEILCILIPLAKITNIFIAGLNLLLPMENVEKKKRLLIKWGALAVVIIVGGGYYLYTTKFSVNREQYAYLKAMHVNSTKQMEYILKHTSKWGRAFVLCLINQFSNTLGMLSSFGWLDYGYPIIGVIGTVGFAKVCFQEESIELKKMDRFLISLMGVGIYTFSCLALYLSWTTVKSKEISGMQGRYLIPMILLLSMLGGIGDSKKNKENYVVDITISVVMIGMMLIVTAIRYY